MGVLMARRVHVLVVLLVAMILGFGIAGTGCVDRVGAAAVRDKHISVKYATIYTSIPELLAATKVAVVATARSVAPDRSSSGSHPSSLVTMEVRTVLRGNPTHQIVVFEYGGQPGEVVSGQVPLAVGHTYLLLLGVDGTTGHYVVLDGVTGLFSYDAATQVATRLDPAATWIPQSISLNLAEAQLRTPAPPIPTPKVLPPIAGACPPGCTLPSDDDAITVLASSANEVAMVTMEAGSPYDKFVIDRVLQGNPHTLIYPPRDEDGDLGAVFDTFDMVAGQSYIVFTSYFRGGTCGSALFSYDPTTEIATLVTSEDGVTPGQIMLPGRVLPIPKTITLRALRERMYPTTGVVYPSDTSEETCPGP
jgi:hypothetical protein